MIEGTGSEISTRWSEALATGQAAGAVPPDAAAAYARTIARRRESAKAAGQDPDGEARLVHDLLAPGARILDAGCGTGRVAIALTELGHPVVGVDADLAMLRVAAELEPRIPFWLADLADLDIPQGVIGGGFDAVVMAGNVVPYLADGTLPAVVAQMRSVLRQGGLLVSGFGIRPSQLPDGLPVTPLSEYEAAAQAAGLVPVERHAGWSREEWREDSEYVVAVHRRAASVARPERRGWRRAFWGR